MLYRNNAVKIPGKAFLKFLNAITSFCAVNEVLMNGFNRRKFPGLILKEFFQNLSADTFKSFPFKHVQPELHGVEEAVESHHRGKGFLTRQTGLSDPLVEIPVPAANGFKERLVVLMKPDEGGPDFDSAFGIAREIHEPVPHGRENGFLRAQAGGNVGRFMQGFFLCKMSDILSDERLPERSL